MSSPVSPSFVHLGSLAESNNDDACQCKWLRYDAMRSRMHTPFLHLPYTCSQHNWYADGYEELPLISHSGAVIRSSTRPGWLALVGSWCVARWPQPSTEKSIFPTEKSMEFILHVACFHLIDIFFVVVVVFHRARVSVCDSYMFAVSLSLSSSSNLKSSVYLRMHT